MSSDDPIEGKVAGLLNERELVINRGADHGVEVGMRFAILNRNGVDIRDPETGDVLGSVPVAKTIVKIVRVEGRMSVGRTFRTITGRSGALAAIMAMSSPDRPETFRVGEPTVMQEIDEEESAIKTGDPAVETSGDEYVLPDL